MTLHVLRAHSAQIEYSNLDRKWTRPQGRLLKVFTGLECGLQEVEQTLRDGISM